MAEKFITIRESRIVNVRYVVSANVEGTEEHARIDLHISGDPKPVTFQNFHSPLKRDALKEAETALWQLRFEMQEDPNG